MTLYTIINNYTLDIANRTVRVTSAGNLSGLAVVGDLIIGSNGSVVLQGSTAQGTLDIANGKVTNDGTIQVDRGSVVFTSMT